MRRFVELAGQFGRELILGRGSNTPNIWHVEVDIRLGFTWEKVTDSSDQQ